MITEATTAEDRALERAIQYIRSGVHPDIAIDRAVKEELSGSGLGQLDTSSSPAPATTSPNPSGGQSLDLPGTPETGWQLLEQDVSTISTEVSPWLWILSVGSFLMAIMNKWEISQMFGSYKRMKHKLLGK